MTLTPKAGRVPRRRVLAGTAGIVLAASSRSTAGSSPQGGAGAAGTVLTRLNPSSLAAPRGYSHVVVASGGRAVYVSGQVPLDKDGTLVGPGDLAAQARQVFENIKVALAAAGATFADVVKLTYFVTDASQVQVVRDVRDTLIDTTRPPASTLVEVRRLVRQEFLLEIDAIAHVG